MNTVESTRETLSNEQPVGPQVCCFVTEDPCQHADSLPQWSQEYLQLTSGEFRGRIVEMSSGPVQLSLIHI